MNITEAVQRACEEPTLADALSWICIWECERVLAQAKQQQETGVSTAAVGNYDTCFKVCIQQVLKAWTKVQNPLERMRNLEEEIEERIYQSNPSIKEIKGWTYDINDMSVLEVDVEDYCGNKFAVRIEL